MKRQCKIKDRFYFLNRRKATGKRTRVPTGIAGVGPVQSPATTALRDTERLRGGHSG